MEPADHRSRRPLLPFERLPILSWRSRQEAVGLLVPLTLPDTLADDESQRTVGIDHHRRSAQYQRFPFRTRCVTSATTWKSSSSSGVRRRRVRTDSTTGTS